MSEVDRLSNIERDYDRCPECGSPAIDPSGETLCICGGPVPTREEEEILALREQLAGAVAENERLREALDAIRRDDFDRAIHPSAAALAGYVLNAARGTGWRTSSPERRHAPSAAGT